MPLELVVADAGHAGLALRRHRGDHALHGTGQCKRLQLLLPSLIQGTENHAEVPHRVALWLGTAILGLRAGAKTELFFARMVGHERIGVALDKTIAKNEAEEAPPHKVPKVPMRPPSLNSTSSASSPGVGTGNTKEDAILCASSDDEV